MHVRSTTVMGDPASIEDGVEFLRKKVMQTLQTTEGCLGLSMLADRENGRCIASTAWETAEAMKATEHQLQASRSAHEAGNQAAARGALDAFEQRVVTHAGSAIPNRWRAQRDLDNVAGDLLTEAGSLRYTLARLGG